MADHTYTKSKTMAASTPYVKVTFDSFSVPAGEVLTGVTLSCTNTNWGVKDTNNQFNLAWNSPYGPTGLSSVIGWSGSGSASVYVGGAMGASATVSINFKTSDMTRYAITCNTTGSGTLTASPTTAYYGQQVTLTPTPGTGYQFSSYTASVSISSNKFFMPNNATTVTANFTKKSYSITVQAGSGGTVTTGGGTASRQYATTFTITAQPNSLYRFTGWTMTGNGTIANASALSTTFTVGDGTATVTANFARIYKTVKRYDGSAWSNECEVWIYEDGAWKECEIWRYDKDGNWIECSHNQY